MFEQCSTYLFSQRLPWSSSGQSARSGQEAIISYGEGSSFLDTNPRDTLRPAASTMVPVGSAGRGPSLGKVLLLAPPYLRLTLRAKDSPRKSKAVSFL